MADMTRDEAFITATNLLGENLDCLCISEWVRRDGSVETRCAIYPRDFGVPGVGANWEAAIKDLMREMGATHAAV